MKLSDYARILLTPPRILQTTYYRVAKYQLLEIQVYQMASVNDCIGPMTRSRVHHEAHTTDWEHCPSAERTAQHHADQHESNDDPNERARNHKNEPQGNPS
jgi:hypothetical protein